MSRSYADPFVFCGLVIRSTGHIRTAGSGTGTCYLVRPVSRNGDRTCIRILLAAVSEQSRWVRCIQPQLLPG